MKGEDAVSPVVGTLLMLGIFIMVGTSAYLVARPQLLEVQEQGAFDAVTQEVRGAMADMKALAVSGKEGAVKKPVVTMPDGQLHSGIGHYVAVSIGIEDDDYSDVAGQSLASGAHRDFYVSSWDPTDTADETRITVHNNGTQLASPTIFQVQRFTEKAVWENEGAWTYEVSDSPAPWPNGQVQEVDFVNPLQTSTYRVRITTNGALAGDVYLYNQTRMTFDLEGETGLRQLHTEAGAVWAYQGGRFYEKERSIYTAPSVYIGSGQFTMRIVDLNITGGAGGGKVSLITNLVADTDLARNDGVSIIRMQFQGPDAEVWENSLEGQGYKKNLDNEGGVYYIFAEFHDSDRKVFPLNVIHARIDMRVRNS